jgi:hypothetical protein
MRRGKNVLAVSLVRVSSKRVTTPSSSSTAPSFSLSRRCRRSRSGGCSAYPSYGKASAAQRRMLIKSTRDGDVVLHNGLSRPPSPSGILSPSMTVLFSSCATLSISICKTQPSISSIGSAHLASAWLHLRFARYTCPSCHGVGRNAGAACAQRQRPGR